MLSSDLIKWLTQTYLRVKSLYSGLLSKVLERLIDNFFLLQEQIFDYVFSHMGINTEGYVNHPIVLTEPVCNPNYCRQRKYPSSRLNILLCVSFLMF